MAAPKLKKSPESLVSRFEEVVPRDAGVERRQMFGYPSAFLNGNMLCGLFQDQFILRLSDTARAKLVKQGAKIFEPMAGRPMKEYVVVPPAIISSDAALSPWLREAVSYVSGMQPKEKKPKEGGAKKTAKKPATAKKARA
jgi:TfoX/Sxy family transcriptional regulator of competence genes